METDYFNKHSWQGLVSINVQTTLHLLRPCHSPFTWGSGVVFSVFQILGSYNLWFSLGNRLSQSVFSLQRWITKEQALCWTITTYVVLTWTFKLNLLISSLHTYWLQTICSVNVAMIHLSNLLNKALLTKMEVECLLRIKSCKTNR